MKKSLILLLLYFSTISYLFSDSLSLHFRHALIDPIFYQIEQSLAIEQISTNHCSSQSYDLAFKSSNYDLEIRYIFFSQIEDFSTFDDFKFYSSILAQIVHFNITGNNTKFPSHLVYFEDKTIDLFNSDYVINFFERNITDDFSSEYNYILVHFFCKQNIGIVCQILLLNDPKILTDNDVKENIIISFTFID